MPFGPIWLSIVHTSHSILSVVCRGTLFLILKSASMVDSIGENSILPSSAVASSSKDSTCRKIISLDETACRSLRAMSLMPGDAHRMAHR